jgi:hypothetical protein
MECGDKHSYELLHGGGCLDQGFPNFYGSNLPSPLKILHAPPLKYHCRKPSIQLQYMKNDEREVSLNYMLFKNILSLMISCY